MSEPGYCLRITLHPLPESFGTLEPYKGGPPNLGPWFCERRLGDHLGLALFGTISKHRHEILPELFNGVSSCELRLIDLSGGSTLIAGELCRYLEAIPRQYVRVHVEGYVASCAIDILMCAGHVSASADSRFGFHSVHASIYGECNISSGDLRAQLQAEHAAAWRMLKRRMVNPDFLLDGTERVLDAPTAAGLNIIDEIL